MKTFTNPLTALAIAMSLTAGNALAGDNEEHAKIKTVLFAYEKALNASDTNAVMRLYADDGVFMPQHSAPNVGKAAVRAAYEGVFKAIKLDIKFSVDEIIQASPQWAFARTRSAGNVTINASGGKGPEANQELFVLQKRAGGDWKIARYIFSTTNPPRQ